jgi:cytochrome c peroxidase
LSGDRDAISDRAKRGALIFYGKGKCAVCHAGALFSDFSFHSLMIPDAGPGADGRGDDLGRFYVTGKAEDKYKFRTPPLRNVTLAPPYFHNGSAQTLGAAIRHHLDPLARADQYEETGAFAYSVDQIEAVSPILVSGTPLTDEEIGRLIDFLGGLEDSQLNAIERIVPSSVPSGLPVSSINAPG